MKNILFPTDFSENARHAIKYYIEMYDQKENMVLLNAFNLPHSGRGMIISINDILQQESEKGLQKEVAYLVKNFQISEEKIKTVSEIGTVGSAVAKLLNREKCDLVVIGTKGASGLKSVLIGSNAADVISNVSSPVLMVPENIHFTGLKNIIFAADYTPNKTAENLAPLIYLARKYKSKIHILNVKKEQSKISESTRETERKNLSLIFAGLEFEHVQVEHNNTSEGIRIYLNKHDADMLCMIPRKRGFFEKLFTGSATEEIAKLASIPLLTLRENNV